MARYRVIWKCGRCGRSGRKQRSNDRDDKEPPTLDLNIQESLKVVVVN